MRWLALLCLMLPATALATDWSADIGYFRREYSAVDQLGATGPGKSLKLASGQGPSIHTSVGWHTKYVSLGLQMQAAYLFLSGQPDQKYSVKGVDIDTTRLVGPLATFDATVGFRTDYFSAEVSAGPALQAIAQRWEMPFDYDFVSHAGVKVTFPYSGMDVCVDINLFVVPTTRAKGDFDISPAINVTFGKANETKSALVVELPTPATAVEAPARKEVAAPLPEQPTPADLSVELTPVAVSKVQTQKAPISEKERRKTAAKKPHRRADENATVKFVVNILRSNPNLDVQIKVGMEFNGSLQQRAEEVKKQLLSRGINGKRIRIIFNKGKKSEAKDIKFLFVVRK